MSRCSLCRLNIYRVCLQNVRLLNCCASVYYRVSFASSCRLNVLIETQFMTGRTKCSCMLLLYLVYLCKSLTVKHALTNTIHLVCWCWSRHIRSKLNHWRHHCLSLNLQWRSWTSTNRALDLLRRKLWLSVSSLWLLALYCMLLYSSPIQILLNVVELTWEHGKRTTCQAKHFCCELVKHLTDHLLLWVRCSGPITGITTSTHYATVWFFVILPWPPVG